jgi:Fe-Mn family superoxide dismutase
VVTLLVVAELERVGPDPCPARWPPHLTEPLAAFAAPRTQQSLGHPELKSKDLEDLLRHINTGPSDSRVAIRNSGGGHANHSLFWTIIRPDGGGSPRRRIADAIKASFNSFDAFKKEFSKAALDHFGSGWAWVINQSGRLVILLGSTHLDSDYAGQ